MKKIIPFCAFLAFLPGVSTTANAAIVQNTVGDYGALAIGTTVTLVRNSLDLVSSTPLPSIIPPNADGDTFQDDYLFTLASVSVGSGVIKSLELTGGGGFSILDFGIAVFLGTPAAPGASLGSVVATTAGEQLTLVIAGLAPATAAFISVTGHSEGSGGSSAGGQYGGTFSITAVPIPPVAVLFLSALAGLAGFSRIRRRKAVAT